MPTPIIPTLATSSMEEIDLVKSIYVIPLGFKYATLNIANTNNYHYGIIYICHSCNISGFQLLYVFATNINNTYFEKDH